jgi:hypothetical protein
MLSTSVPDERGFYSTGCSTGASGVSGHGERMQRRARGGGMQRKGRGVGWRLWLSSPNRPRCRRGPHGFPQRRRIHGRRAHAVAQGEAFLDLERPAPPELRERDVGAGVRYGELPHQGGHSARATWRAQSQIQSFIGRGAHGGGTSGPRVSVLVPHICHPRP